VCYQVENSLVDLVIRGMYLVTVKGGGDIGIEEGIRYFEGVEVCA
jgi:hypothetical protein